MYNALSDVDFDAYSTTSTEPMICIKSPEKAIASPTVKRAASPARALSARAVPARALPTRALSLQQSERLASAVSVPAMTVNERYLKQLDAGCALQSRNSAMSRLFVSMPMSSAVTLSVAVNLQPVPILPRIDESMFDDEPVAAAAQITVTFTNAARSSTDAAAEPHRTASTFCRAPPAPQQPLSRMSELHALAQSRARLIAATAAARPTKAASKRARSASPARAAKKKKAAAAPSSPVKYVYNQIVSHRVVGRANMVTVEWEDGSKIEHSVLDLFEDGMDNEALVKFKSKRARN